MTLTFPDFVSNAIYATGQWEPYVTAYVRQSLRPGDIFIDVGANIGYFTLLAAGLVGNKGSVHAIEASRRIFTRLQRNVDLNGYRHVRCIHAAASSAAGELSLYLAPDDNDGHSTTVEALAHAEGMRLEGTVAADTLMNLVGEEKLFSARLVKIDVEGAELSVLNAIFPVLERFSNATEFLVELSPDYCPGRQDDVDRIFNAFAAAGYGLFRLPNAYSASALLERPGIVTPVPLAAPPTGQTDVLVSRTFRDRRRAEISD
ncbi:MAG: FkbM family methyltransferase [Pseudomonadota bacterium]|nr:FkbM family methyltransferase [Pseudomonadota bacterium]